MRKNIVRYLILFFLVVGFNTDSIAEPPEGFDRPSKEQMEKVRKRIETLKMWKLTNALDLNEKTAARLFPLLNTYDKKRVETERKLRDGMFDLRHALRDKREGQLRDILERLEKNHKTLQRIRDEERADLRKILTIEQQAHFIIFQHEFQKEIRKIIGEVRDRRHEMFRRDRPLERPFPEKPFPPERP